MGAQHHPEGVHHTLPRQPPPIVLPSTSVGGKQGPGKEGHNENRSGIPLDQERHRGGPEYKLTGFYSRLFVVPKKNGKLRPVLDLSSLNTHIVVEHFRMETTRSIRKGIKVDDWAVSIDLQDAYLHVPICQASRRYLRFLSEGKVYQFKVLPLEFPPHRRCSPS